MAGNAMRGEQKPETNRGMMERPHLAQRRPVAQVGDLHSFASAPARRSVASRGRTTVGRKQYKLAVVCDSVWFVPRNGSSIPAGVSESEPAKEELNDKNGNPPF